MTREHIHFVTGRLAAGALESVLRQLAPQVGFDYSIDVLPITVAALMTPRWVARHLRVPEGTSRVMIPGYCEGDLQPLRQHVTVDVERGPRDLADLPEYFGRQKDPEDDYGGHDIEILAEINHAPRLSRDDLLTQARELAAAGADLIDIGCDPGETWRGVADAVRALRDEGLRVSIDSWNPREVEPAVRAGAELVLSVNASNREAARDWGCEVVVIPDDPRSLEGLDETAEYLAAAAVPFRLDPILEPIGCGFAHSLGRYLDTRRRHPDAEIMMGIGNLTELTDADSAGINVLLLGFCQELGIRSVLTTQVINWARSSVRECDLARRLVAYAQRHGVPPKHREPNLVMLRDPKLTPFGVERLDELAEQLKDPNYRLFAEEGWLHLVSAGIHLRDRDPFALFDQLLALEPKNVDASHAFYLGYELCKAATALTLGKAYRQDQALHWGMLTVPENSHRLARTSRRRAAAARSSADHSSANSAANEGGGTDSAANAGGGTGPAPNAGGDDTTDEHSSGN